MSTTTMPAIGLIGLGALGSAIAGRLVAKGVPLGVWNRSPEKMLRLPTNGATTYSTIEELCRESRWVLSCVSDDSAMLQVNRTIANSRNKPAMHISFSSCSPAAVREAANHAHNNGLSFLNSPVLGRPDVVLAGKAGYLVAGNTSSAKAAKPLFATLSGTYSYMGPAPEQSAIIKLAMNYLTALTIGGLSEIVSTLEHNQINTDAFLDVISNSPAGSPLIALFGGLILRKEFTPPLFDLQLAQKDIGYFADLIPTNTNCFLYSAIKDHITATNNTREHALDWSGLASHLFK